MMAVNLYLLDLLLPNESLPLPPPPSPSAFNEQRFPLTGRSACFRNVTLRQHQQRQLQQQLSPPTPSLRSRYITPSPPRRSRSETPIPPESPPPSKSDVLQ